MPNQTMTSDIAAKPEYDIDIRFALYAYRVHGPEAVVRAVEQLWAGRSAAFAVCDRPESMPPIIREILQLCPIKGKAVIRICNKDGSPEGVGSSTLYHLGSIDQAGEVTDLNRDEAIAIISWTLAAMSPWCFLVRELSAPEEKT